MTSIVAQCLVLFALVACANAAAKPTVFAVIGDWGRGLDGDYSGEANAPGAPAQMFAIGKALGKTCAIEKCEFAIGTGDNFYQLGVNAFLGPYDPQWQTSFNLVYNNPSLTGIKWYQVLGNHDYGVNGSQKAPVYHSVAPQMEYTSFDPLQRWYLPTRYYNVDVPNVSQKVRITVTDTSPFIQSYCDSSNPVYRTPELLYACNANIRKGNLAFFDRSLAEARKAGGWSIAVGHHPLYGKNLKNQPLLNDFMPSVVKHTPELWFNGHDHTLAYRANPVAPKTAFLTSGAGSIFEPVDLAAGVYVKGTVWNSSVGGYCIVKLWNTYGTVEFFGAGDGKVPSSTPRSLYKLTIKKN